jgi:hypothetical protein
MYVAGRRLEVTLQFLAVTERWSFSFSLMVMVFLLLLRRLMFVITRIDRAGAFWLTIYISLISLE